MWYITKWASLTGGSIPRVPGDVRLWNPQYCLGVCRRWRGHHRMDIIWGYLNNMKSPDGSSCFQKLAQVAILVLTLPHSNAAEERVFSLVNKNKMKLWTSLQLDGTLSSILTIKLAAGDIPCHEFEPPSSVLETAKKQPCCTVGHTVFIKN